MQKPQVRLTYPDAKLNSAASESVFTRSVDPGCFWVGACGTLIGRRPFVRALRSLPSAERLGLAGWHHPKPGGPAKELFGETAGRVSIGCTCRYRNANRVSARDFW